jgi:two-component system response regulator YesN
MITTLIVDDEIWVCQLIKKIVNWENMGFSLIGEAYDGIEALKFIKEKRPDFVVTDIRMPGLDGISMIKQAKEAGLNPCFIILSGYGEFEYAKDAIEYSALGYLLKPIDREELIKLLAKVKRHISYDLDKKRAEEKLVYSINQLKEQYFYKLLSENSEGVSADKVNGQYRTQFREGIFQTLIFKFDFNANDDTLRNEIISNTLISTEELISSELKNNCYEIVSLKMRNMVICILNYSPDRYATLKNDIEITFKKIENLLHKKNCFLTLGAGRSVNDLSQLPESFTWAQHSIVSRIVLGAGKIINVADKKYEVTEIKYLFPKSKEIKLTGYIEVFDVEKASEFIRDIFCIFYERKDISPFLAYRIAYEIIEIFFKSVERYNNNFETDCIRKTKACEDLEECSSIEDILGFFTNLLTIAKDYYENYRQHFNIKAIEIVKEYIHNHFQEEISLNDAAELVYLNPKYLSELFKKETGITFTDYIINYRLEVAKEYLEDARFNINEVAELVGYKDIKYFSKLFTKIVGISPSKYKKMFT